MRILVIGAAGTLGSAVSEALRARGRDGDVFPGYPPVDLADAVRAYIRSVEGAETGKTYRLPV